VNNEDVMLIERMIEARKFRLVSRVSAGTLEAAGIQVTVDRIMDNFAASIELNLYGEKVGQAYGSESMAFPTSWWQHLKRDYAPQWFLHRWPVKTTTWTLNAKADMYDMYPQANIPLNPADYGRPVRVAMPPTFESGWGLDTELNP
jgi:hypothetical protein